MSGDQSDRFDRTADPADPDPRRTPDMRPSGLSQPGETPAGESSTADAGPQETYNPPTGWSRTPLLLIAVITAMFVGFFFAYAILLI